MKDTYKTSIKVRDFITPCGHIGILHPEGIYAVTSINKNCFHIDVPVPNRQGKLIIKEACLDKEISTLFKVIDPDLQEINLDEILNQ